MSAAVEQRAQIPSGSGMRWARILVTAVLLEVVLVAVRVPIGASLDDRMPGSNATADYTVFFTAVPLACLVFGYVAGMLVVRKVSRQYAAHGLWVGVFATALYFPGGWLTGRDCRIRCGAIVGYAGSQNSGMHCWRGGARTPTPPLAMRDYEFGLCPLTAGAKW